MHTQYFYAGLEAGLYDDMTKQAILGKIRHALGAPGRLLDKGDDVLYDTLLAGMHRQGDKVGDKAIRGASNFAHDYITGYLPRAVQQPAIEAGMWAGRHTSLGSMGAAAADMAISTAAKNQQAIKKLPGAAMQGAGNVLQPGARHLQSARQGIVRQAPADMLDRRAQIQQRLGIKIPGQT